MNYSSLQADFGIISLNLFLVGSILSVLSPGPTMLLVFTSTVEEGTSTGIWTTIGAIVGIFLTLLFVNFGIEQLFRSFPGFFKLLTYLGSGILFWLGFISIKKGLGNWSQNIIKNTKTTLSDKQFTYSGQHPFIQGFLVAIFNPIAFIFYIAFFHQFIDNSFTKPHLAFSLLSMINLSIQLLSFIALVLMGWIVVKRPSIMHWFKLHPHWVSGLEIGIGLIFIAYGFRFFLI